MSVYGVWYTERESGPDSRHQEILSDDTARRYEDAGVRRILELVEANVEQITVDRGVTPPELSH